MPKTPLKYEPALLLCNNLEISCKPALSIEICTTKYVQTVYRHYISTYIFTILILYWFITHFTDFFIVSRFSLFCIFFFLLLFFFANSTDFVAYLNRTRVRFYPNLYSPARSRSAIDKYSYRFWRSRFQIPVRRIGVLSEYSVVIKLWVSTVSYATKKLLVNPFQLIILQTVLHKLSQCHFWYGNRNWSWGFCTYFYCVMFEP